MPTMDAHDPVSENETSYPELRKDEFVYEKGFFQGISSLMCYCSNTTFIDQLSGSLGLYSDESFLSFPNIKTLKEAFYHRKLLIKNVSTNEILIPTAMLDDGHTVRLTCIGNFMVANRTYYCPYPEYSNVEEPEEDPSDPVEFGEE